MVTTKTELENLEVILGQPRSLPTGINGILDEEFLYILEGLRSSYVEVPMELRQQYKDIITKHFPATTIIATTTTAILARPALLGRLGSRRIVLGDRL
jgi:hypothetical protein